MVALTVIVVLPGALLEIADQADIWWLAIVFTLVLWLLFTLLGYAVLLPGPPFVRLELALFRHRARSTLKSTVCLVGGRARIQPPHAGAGHVAVLGVVR